MTNYISTLLLVSFLFIFGHSSYGQEIENFITIKSGQPHLVNPSSFKVDGLNHSAKLNYGIGFERLQPLYGWKNYSINYGLFVTHNQFKTTWGIENERNSNWRDTVTNEANLIDFQFPVFVNHYLPKGFLCSVGLMPVYHAGAKISSSKELISQNQTLTSISEDENTNVCNPWFRDCTFNEPKWQSPLEIWGISKIGYEFLPFQFALKFEYNFVKAPLHSFAEESIVVYDLNDFSLFESYQTVGTSQYVLSFQINYRFF